MRPLWLETGCAPWEGWGFILILFFGIFVLFVLYTLTGLRSWIDILLTFELIICYKHYSQWSRFNFQLCKGPTISLFGFLTEGTDTKYIHQTRIRRMCSHACPIKLMLREYKEATKSYIWMLHTHSTQQHKRSLRSLKVGLRSQLLLITKI